jgi:hypothetical protein
MLVTHVKLDLGMELTLNLGWALLTAWMLWVWLRKAMRPATERRIQAIALAVVILILLPAISMTDDLVAAQNPAEIDCMACLARRDHHCCSPHTIVPAGAAAVPIPAYASPKLTVFSMAVPRRSTQTAIQSPALNSIQNRPPPAA